MNQKNPIRDKTSRFPGCVRENESIARVKSILHAQAQHKTLLDQQTLSKAMQITSYFLLSLSLSQFNATHGFLSTSKAYASLSTKQSSSTNLKAITSSYKPKLITKFDSSDFPGETGSTWPYTEKDMLRLDSSVDSNFYDTPRFVTHIDDNAIKSLTNYYKYEFNSILGSKETKSLDVLDLCSSWISHLPKDIPYNNVVGVGMNEKELSANEQLTDYKVQDLNVNPKLEHLEDNSFDIICNVVSVDYLTNPQIIFQEM